MPHLVIEHALEEDEAVTIAAVAKACHDAALASGLFSEADIKVRSLRAENSLIGGEVASFLHVTIKLLSGRDAETKKVLTSGVLDKIQSLGISASSMSVEALDIDRASYSKIVR